MRCLHKTKYARTFMSDEDRQRTRKEINATNRRRAKDMESKVAKFLSGSRVPLSGACAQWKGDCIIPLKNNPGRYIIECKLSDSQNKLKGPRIPLSLSYFPKLQKETESMSALFGILIFRYFFFKEYYVCIRCRDVRMLIDRYIGTVEGLEILLQSDVHINMRKKDGTLPKSYDLYKNVVDSTFIVVTGINGLKLRVADEDYIVLLLEQFRDIFGDI